MNQRFFCFVCPASSWWCDAQLCSLWICTGGVRPQSDRRGQYSLHPPCTCPGPAGAASTSVRHQHPAEELCHLSGCRNRWEIFFFLTSWNLWKMDELGQEKWKRVSNQMLFFFWWFSLWPAPWSPARVWDQLLCDLPPTWQRLPRCLWALAAKYLTKLKYDCNTEPESFSVSVQECYIDYLTYHTHPLFSVSTAMAFLSRFVWLIGAFFLSQCWWTYLILIRLAALCSGEEYRIPLWMNTFPLSWWGTHHGLVSTTSFHSYDMQKCSINGP